MRHLPIVCCLALLALSVSAFAQVRNGDLGRRGPNPPYFTQENVEKLRANGWTCPDVEQWPWWWSAYGSGVSIEWPRSGGQTGGYGRISGASGYLSCYHGHPVTGDLVWLDEPKPLEDVRIAVDAEEGELRDVQAKWPYYFEESQQPVQRTAEASVNDGRVEITVPEFRYHTMIVFRFDRGE